MAYLGKITKEEAVASLNPDAQVKMVGNDLESCIITILNDAPEISKADIQAEMDRLQVEYDAQEYARKREGEYPPTKDFMEAYTEKEIGGDSTKWDAYVINYNKVRTENPK
jgi:hypothetical protein